MEKRRVNKRSKGEILEERKSKVCQCVHREMGAHWGGGERSLPLVWHNVLSQACAQGPMGVGCPGLEQSGKGSAEAGRGGVDGCTGGDQARGSDPPLVR